MALTLRSRRHLFTACLLVCSLAGMAIVYLATWRYGPGISTDAAHNLAAAWNLLHGRGLVDVYGHPLAQWPPLYAWLLAALSFASRMDVVPVGWHLNALVFGASIYFTGILLRQVFPDEPAFACVGAVIVATCLGIIQISGNIASDPLLLLFTILFLLVAARYGQQRRARDLLLMGLFALLGSFQRYAGLSLVAAGAGTLAYLDRRQPLRGLLRGTAFAILTGAPIFAWGVFHNLPADGELFGSHLQPDVWGNLVATVTKLLYWFIPFPVIEKLTPFGILAAMLVLLLLLNRRGQWKDWWGSITSDEQVASSFFFVLYAGMLVFYVSYREHRNLESQRIHMVILPSLLLLIFSSIRALVFPHFRSLTVVRRQQVLALVALAWLIYPAAKIWKYESKSAGIESSGNNLYNTRVIHEGTFLTTAQTLPDHGLPIYSNYEVPAWLYLRTNIGSVPRRDKAAGLDPEGLAQFRASMTANGNGYLIWFNTVHIREDLPLPEQLQQVARLQPVLLSEAGDIYELEPAAP